MKATLITLCATALLLTSCAEEPIVSDSYELTPVRPRLGLKPAKPRSAPAWVYSLPRDPRFVYTLGEARNLEKKDDALERAWISGLLRIGMTQFPELGSLRSESMETLRNADYKRQFVMQLDRIDWRGLREVEEMGSPFVTFDEESGQFSAYRLIAWARTDIVAAKARISKSRKNTVPDSPEVARKIEEDLVKEVREIRELNRKIGNRDEFVGKILRQARCGVTIEDLFRILGSPDREGAYNRSATELEYYWGNYKVTHWKRESTVYSITPNNGGGNMRIVCGTGG